MSYSDTIQAVNSFRESFNDNGPDIIKFIGAAAILLMIYWALKKKK